MTKENIERKTEIENKALNRMWYSLLATCIILVVIIIIAICNMIGKFT